MKKNILLQFLKNGNWNTFVNLLNDDCSIGLQCSCHLPYIRSPYHFIYTALVEGRYNLAVTTDIILEYQEIITQKYGAETASSFMALLVELPNVSLITTYYHWQLITADPDDDKYCDCAVAANAAYIVTEDRHFDVLKNISFPPISTISVDTFTSLIK